MDKLLDGKVALITGGSSGIGTAAVRQFAGEGARVAFTYRSGLKAAEELTAELGPAVRAYHAEMSDFARSQEVVQEVLGDFGTLDVLVNNAGANQDKVIWKMTEEAWDDVIATDLKGVFNYTRGAVPAMREKKGGRIITVSSINGLRGKFGQSNYAAAKAGVIGFSKTLARELGRAGITVNVVCPGLIATQMILDMPEDFKQKALEEILLGRIGTPEDVADLLVFLASDRSRHITGEVIKIDGGQYV